MYFSGAPNTASAEIGISTLYFLRVKLTTIGRFWQESIQTRLIDYDCNMQTGHHPEISERTALRQVLSRRMKSARFGLLLLGLLTLTSPVVPAATPSTIMSQAMLAMMDAMGDLAQRFRSRSNWSIGGRYKPYGSLYGLSGYPQTLYTLPGGRPLQSPMPGPGGIGAPLYPATPTLSPVDGIWLGGGGELVLVMYGHFRIYANADVYRDGRFVISDDRLVMYDPASERRMVFDYRLEDGRMLLRSEWGDILVFNQLPIPIPPYTLFTNPTATYRY
jgi:hypothetical protein